MVYALWMHIEIKISAITAIREIISMEQNPSQEAIMS